MIVDIQSQSLLSGRKGLVVGIANENSIAYSCARMFRNCGAELAVTWINDKTRVSSSRWRGSSPRRSSMPLDVGQPGALESVFDTMRERWGRLDFLLHSIAFAPQEDLHGRVADISREGFAHAMDISCHSFMRMASLAEPLMDKGGTLLTMTYLGAEEVVPSYGVMGPVKAALEAVVRYLATELGPRGIRVTPCRPDRSRRARPPAFRSSTSCSPRRQARTVAARGRDRRRRLVCAFLVSDAARAITGDVHYIDGGCPHPRLKAPNRAYPS